MNGNKFILDTNAILYILKGDEALADALYEKILFASIVTEIELLSYKHLSVSEEESIRKFLREFTVTGISNTIKEKCIDIRRSYGLKLPDSLIAATAICLELPLVTSDKQFKKIKKLELLFNEK